MAEEINKKTFKTVTKFRRENNFIYQFGRHPFVFIIGIVIPLILYGIFIGYPLVSVFTLSFFKWDGISNHMPFVGLQNYISLVQDPAFIQSLVNNIKWAVLTIIFPVGLGLLLAAILHSGNIYFSNFFRAIIFLPTTMSLVGVGIMFALILNPSFGALNTLFNSSGLGFLAQEWLGNSKLALYTLIFVFSWGYIGLPMILFYAGMSGIPVELYEAASLEGSGAFQNLRFITIPLLSPVTTMTIMLTVINSLRAFDLVMVMTGGGPFGQTTVLGYFMYLETFGNYKFGYGAAISVVILLLSIVFAAVYIKNVASEAMHVS